LVGLALVVALAISITNDPQHIMLAGFFPFGVMVIGRGCHSQIIDLGDGTVLKKYYTSEPELMSREIEALKRYSGTGVFPEFVRQVDEYSFIMTKLEGVTLEKATPGMLAEGTFARLRSKMDRFGIIYGDWDPANIIVGPDGELSLCDAQTVGRRPFGDNLDSLERRYTKKLGNSRQAGQGLVEYALFLAALFAGVVAVMFYWPQIQAILSSPITALVMLGLAAYGILMRSVLHASATGYRGHDAGFAEKVAFIASIIIPVIYLVLLVLGAFELQINLPSIIEGLLHQSSGLGVGTVAMAGIVGMIPLTDALDVPVDIAQVVEKLYRQFPELKDIAVKYGVKIKVTTVLKDKDGVTPREGQITGFKYDVEGNITFAVIEINPAVADPAINSELLAQITIIHELLELDEIAHLLKNYPALCNSTERLSVLIGTNYTDLLALRRQITYYQIAGVPPSELEMWEVVQRELERRAEKINELIRALMTGENIFVASTGKARAYYTTSDVVIENGELVVAQGLNLAGAFATAINEEYAQYPDSYGALTTEQLDEEEAAAAASVKLISWATQALDFKLRVIRSKQDLEHYTERKATGVNFGGIIIPNWKKWIEAWLTSPYYVKIYEPVSDAIVKVISRRLHDSGILVDWSHLASVECRLASALREAIANADAWGNMHEEGRVIIIAWEIKNTTKDGVKIVIHVIDEAAWVARLNIEDKALQPKIKGRQKPEGTYGGSGAGINNMVKDGMAVEARAILLTDGSRIGTDFEINYDLTEYLSYLNRSGNSHSDASSRGIPTPVLRFLIKLSKVIERSAVIGGKERRVILTAAKAIFKQRGLAIPTLPENTVFLRAPPSWKFDAAAYFDEKTQTLYIILPQDKSQDAVLTAHEIWEATNKGNHKDNPIKVNNIKAHSTTVAGEEAPNVVRKGRQSLTSGMTPGTLASTVNTLTSLQSNSSMLPYQRWYYSS
ncbi:MAG: hypothetical protein WCL25_01060, partial [bacterium]